ncbi:glycosyltransferase family 2 protein [Methylopila sp. M107]|uniref:glycosyltransferase family 2 protein n=1 Tax=Methylopila sp. M107 TaxID=1101190 RepID=UPI00036B4DB4|nr:glycosyltransferase family 2 protein [Methylopila sp. M107]
MADIGVVICTYRRPEPLSRALASVFALDNPDGVSLEITIVDNSDDSGARPVVEALRAASPYRLNFVEAHPANISVARNAGIAAAQSPILAFLDDDETFDAGWLSGALAGLRAFDHDVFFGRVRPDFADERLATPAIRTLYSREVPAPAGADLFAMGPRKTPGITLGTNNSIFRRARVFDGEPPFDPAFGNAGGEDYDLFCRLQAKGLRFGWLPDAAVTEEVPVSRCDGAYLRRRSYAGGQVYAAAVSAATATPNATRWMIRAKAAAQGLLMAPTALGLPFKGPAARADFGFKLAGVLGKLSLGTPYPLYRENDPKRAS